MSDYKFSERKKSIRCTIFTGGDAPEPKAVESYFISHAPDIVIAADSGLDTLKRYADAFKSGEAASIDLTPDFIVGDFDSISDVKLIDVYGRSGDANIELCETAEKRGAVRIERFPCDKDFTDTELALDAAFREASLQNAIPFITLIGGGGGRLDHLLAICDSFCTPQHADVWLLSNEAVYLLKSGTACDISDLKRSDIVSVARTTSSRTGGKLVSHGLFWENFRREGMPSISNRISENYFTARKPVTFSACETDFLLILPLSARVTFRPQENR
ncbi:thiamine pyrophosphokinase [Treponema socranskii]|uniref:thiamine pyrophosphokinase n=1 Tax=Treponema socranskii TaxID=53419 RepID=UPI0028E583A4|nr:thiamine pyrophosphokinase [Treponema socranskii]